MFHNHGKEHDIQNTVDLDLNKSAISLKVVVYIIGLLRLIPGMFRRTVWRDERLALSSSGSVPFTGWYTLEKMEVMDV